MKNGTLYQHVYFVPWVGFKYRTQGLFGKKVLILGESHYEFLEGQRLEPGITVRAVTEASLGKDGTPFWSRIKTVIGGEKFQDNPMEFWDSVAFYNYVQVSAGFGPRKRPSSQAFNSAELAFWEVLHDLLPDRLVVAGQTLWSWLPGTQRQWPSIKADGMEIPVEDYILETGHTVTATAINHPAGGLSNKVGIALRTFLLSSR